MRVSVCMYDRKRVEAGEGWKEGREGRMAGETHWHTCIHAGHLQLHQKALQSKHRALTSVGFEVRNWGKQCKRNLCVFILLRALSSITNITIMI